MNRVVALLDLLLASVLALLLLAAMDFAPDVYRARSTEPEDVFALLLFSALIVPACATAGVAGLILLRGRPTVHVTPRAASRASAGVAGASGIFWVVSFATGGEPWLRVALALPVGLFVTSAWRLELMHRAATHR